ncbi:MAG: glycosyl hydrolase family 57 [Beggiatoa sp. IS2]|nr:MAG: glycosyl hydrolase family 57 [Beggiatoa sp. IS2]
MIFTRILQVELPKIAEVGKGFTVVMIADGEIPFAQVILRHGDGWEWICKEKYVAYEGDYRYCFQIPAANYHAGTAYLQVEGCRVANILVAGPDDWITAHYELQITAAPVEKAVANEPKPQVTSSSPTITLGQSDEPVIYFGIHKHMHQPYYNAVDTDYWDGEKDAIFGQRQGPYTHFIPTAVQQYVDGGLPHGGLSTSWSGSLIEQLNRCDETGHCQGAFRNWHYGLRRIAQAQTAFGHPRVDFTAFGFFHPLMPLIPARDVVGQILWHRTIVHEAFGVQASDVLFPPETAFQPHIIPALKQAGVSAVIYDSIHHFRACKNYPYSGKNEGMLPPNLADQENPEVNDWLQLHNIWAPSQISPQLLKPCLLYYVDHLDQRHEIIGVPAERYLGNEDARGGYGALQYESVMGQIYEHIRHHTYDPAHPPFFLLHSDGDNHGGGADSYYGSNTGRLVEMCRTDRRFQLITIKDYLKQFPVDPTNTVHLEPGSWAGADNGDPQFTKWFSWADKDYSPDLNSWAILTAFQNMVHALEDAGEAPNLVNTLKRLLYTAETSCYWYWTGQEIWDAQVTHALNKGMNLAHTAVTRLIQTQQDVTAPTIFVPWVRPANPGGQDWGPGGLVPAIPEATFRTFVYDIMGIKKVTLHYQEVGGQAKQLEMQNIGAYPSRTQPSIIATQYRAILPAGMGNIRYFVEAIDNRDNVAYSPVGRIYIAGRAI